MKTAMECHIAWLKQRQMPPEAIQHAESMLAEELRLHCVVAEYVSDNEYMKIDGRWMCVANPRYWDVAATTKELIGQITPDGVTQNEYGRSSTPPVRRDAGSNPALGFI